jgi:phosphatidate phosphatase APP1
MGLSDKAKSAADSALQKLNEKARSSETIQKVAAAEDWLTEQRMSRKLGKETFRGTKLTVHRGYAYGDVVKFVVRTAESARILEESSSMPYADVAKANVRRHWSLALAGVVVRAELQGLTVEGVTDRHGFAALTMKVPDLAPGWHEVTVTTVPQRDDIIEEVTSTGRVFKPHPKAAFAVISDLDDTVIRSGLTEGLAAMRRTLLGDQHTRQAIPGVSSWYRGMARQGSVDGVEPGFFYVSTGSWSFYEMLVQFLQLRGFPRGPLFLTDWGPTNRYLLRSGALHKKHTIGRLMQAYPTTDFVMVGDTGQGDFDAYTDAARHFPDRVKLIVLLPVGDPERDAEVKELAIAARGEGVPVHVVDSVAEAATIALELGLCDSMTLEEVRTELGAVF